MEQRNQNVSPFSNEARNTYVVNHITESLIRLLRKKEIQQISISEIVEDAEVGRTSFYRNFKTKEDVLKKYIAGKLIKWEAEFKASGKDPNLNSERYGSFFEHLKEDSDFVMLLQRRKLLNLFLDVFIELNGPKKEDVNVWAYTKSFVVYGTYGWIEEWVSRGMQESADTMAQMLASNGMK